MYVDDMTLEEAWEWEAKLQRQISRRLISGGGRPLEQLQWDLEDIHARIQEIDPTAGTE